jgi:hypothetical protein
MFLKVRHGQELERMVREKAPRHDEFTWHLDNDRRGKGSSAVGGRMTPSLMSDFGFPGTTKLPRVGGFVKCCSLYMALETTVLTDNYHALIRGLVTA